MGERAGERSRELAAVRAAVDLGVRLIDTAEMYGDGAAEEIVGEAIRGRRDGLYIVSKCYPHHAGAKTMPQACERSLARLGVDRIDCYLLHWRGRVPLKETVDTFEKLVDRGLIARWGVSNFDIDDMSELFAVPGGERCAANQVLYHAADRAVEAGLLALCREREIPLMAYSPLGQGELLRNRAFASIARSAQLTPAQLALAFVMSRDGVVAIPKSSHPDRVRENLDAQSITLDAATLARIDAAFPPPSGRTRISLA